MTERQEMLLKLAIKFIYDHLGYIGIDDSVFYDDAECDGYALIEDLKIEFDIEE